MVMASVYFLQYYRFFIISKTPGYSSISVITRGFGFIKLIINMYFILIFLNNQRTLDYAIKKEKEFKATQNTDEE